MARSSTAQPLAAPSEARGGSYERHRPEQTILYKTLQAHWRTFLAEVGNHDSGSTLPRFVIEEIEAFLKCGILAHGFVRVSCDGCGTNRVVALSCKRRGFCPSCVGRRMCDFAAHFVDNIAPRTPIRQWVLSVPHGLRFRMAFDPTTTSLVLRIFVQVISSWMRRRARTLRIKGRLETGAVTAIQRFGSAANLNLHFH
ncbi:MAG: transposase zinc-binding domain-containing protein, partial [Myxococcales bacterium]